MKKVTLVRNELKLNDKILKEALRLEAIIKESSLRLGVIKKACKEKGSFCTHQFAVSVKEQDCERLVGKQAFIDQFGYDELKKRELLQMITFEIVKIAPKVS